MRSVVVLGCGPAGLFAAKAVKEMGCTPLIHSDKKKSTITGAQYLTMPIPGLTQVAPDGLIESMRLGTKERYAQRVYGESATPSTWAEYRHWTEPAWNLQAAYDEAWDEFEEYIVDMKLECADVEAMTAYFPLVISTIPQWSICKGGHIFESISILIYKGAFAADARNNFVHYNGTEIDGWYRISKIFGTGTVETVAGDRSNPIFQEGAGAEAGFKIVGNDCDCHPNLVRAGRMGLWKRGVLTQHAYSTTVQACAEHLGIAVS